MPAPLVQLKLLFPFLLNATIGISAESSVAGTPATAQLLETSTDLPHPEYQHVNTTSEEHQRRRWLKWEWE